MVRLAPLLLAFALLAGCGGDAPGGAITTPGGRPAATTPTGGVTQRALRLGVLGDSYSNGEAVGIERSWPAVMAEQLTRDGLPIEVVANPSVTGATTAQMLDAGLPPIRAARPDVMTVMLGVNDQVQGQTTGQFSADEDRALREAIRITGSPKRVIAVDIPDYSVAPVASQFGDPEAISRAIDAFNTVVRTVAERRGVRVVSIVDLSRRLGSGGIAGDGLHPSAAQLADWAKRIAPVARRQWADLSSSAG